MTTPPEAIKIYCVKCKANVNFDHPDFDHLNREMFTVFDQDFHRTSPIFDHGH